MPKAIPNPEPQWNSRTRQQAPSLEPWVPDQPLDGNLLGHGASGLSHSAFDSTQTPVEGCGLPGEGNLGEENRQLRSIVAELQDLLEDATSKNQRLLAERQREFDILLEEKTETIRTLHLRVQELDAKKAAPAATPKEADLLRVNEELERERCLIEQERRDLEEDLRQFRDDEKTMTQQMREMEVLMARERAELARQRSELQRILDEIRLELEKIERDGGLNEKLTQLRQRYQDVAKRSGRGAPEAPAAARQAISAQAGQEAPKKDSGFIRRFFG